MQIAFFVGSFPVISETFILNQITGLIDRGHIVHIYARQVLDRESKHDEIAKYDLLNATFQYGDMLKDIPPGHLKRTIYAGKYLLNKELSHKILLRTLNIRRYGSDALSLKLFFRAIPFLKSPVHYDIVHCHFGHNGRIATDLSEIGAIQSKIITSFHGSDISRYINKNGPSIYDKLFKKGNLFLPISENWKRKLIELGCDERKIKVHRMGIDTRRFIPGDSFLNNKEIRILSIGRLVKKKGFTHGINAVATLLKAFPKMEYLIVGDGPLKDSLKESIDKADADGRIKILGWKTQEEIVELMRTSHLFLAPSVTDDQGDQEGVPVVLMEAMATGLPVISTHHSGIPELVRDGESGFLLPEGDERGIKEKISLLIKNPTLRAEMGRKGRNQVIENFDINSLNNDLVQIYEALL